MIARNKWIAMALAIMHIKNISGAIPVAYITMTTKDGRTTSTSVVIPLPRLQQIPRLSCYGGMSGHDIFQKQSAPMPGILAQKISEGQSLSTILDYSVQVRSDIANQSNSKDKESFAIHRLTNPGASLTEMGRYPFMRMKLGENLTQHPVPLLEFTSADDDLELRIRRMNLLEWAKVQGKEHNALNQLSVFLNQLITQKDGRGNHRTTMYDPKTGEANTHYGDALTQANQLLRSGKAPSEDIQLMYVEFRFKDSNIPTRCFMSPWDAKYSKSDYSNVPFFLLHPSPDTLKHHLAWTQEAFEKARYATGTNEEKYIQISKFIYRWSLTMPMRRGSAAIGEWLAGGLYILHGLTPPKISFVSHIDELAQSSFSWDSFNQAYMNMVPKN